MKLKPFVLKTPTRLRLREMRSTNSKISAKSISIKPSPFSTKLKMQSEVSIKKVFKK